MKRLALLLGLATIFLAACAPQANVETNVVPWLFSARQVGDTVVLQGRYLGDGSGGEAEGSYVVLGADARGGGGVRAQALSWTSNRIEVAVPAGVGYGYAFVYVDGVRSTGLPISLD